MPNLWVGGIVSHRNHQPYIILNKDEMRLAQLSMAQARNFAMDILNMCSRTEADAMIIKFFSKSNFPEGAAAALMQEFRDFRAELDAEQVNAEMREPEDQEPNI